MTIHPEAGAHPAGAHASAGATGGASPAGGATGGASPAGDGQSLGDLFADVSRDLSTLVRQEVALARAELQQSATKAGKGAGLLSGAAVAGYFVLLFLSVALWWGLGDAIGHGWSALVVAVLWAIVAAVLVSMGRKEIKQVRGLPRTAATVKQVPEALKGNEETAR